MVVPTADSDFCHTTVESGWLTTEQMTHAAMHYKLGRSRSGETIFWMIDEWGKALTGDVQGFPLLLKLLDAREMLSVQVHPDDA